MTRGDRSKIDQLTRTVESLSKRAEKLIDELSIDVSDAETTTEGSELFQKVANTYERLARARQLSRNSPAWERSDGEYLMGRFWDLRQKLSN